MEGRFQWHRRLLGDLLTWAAVKQTERLPQKERSRYLGVLAVTFVPEALARAKDPGRGRWGPGMGSTVPPNQAGWPCATRCWKVQLVSNLDLDLGQNGAKVGLDWKHWIKQKTKLSNMNEIEIEREGKQIILCFMQRCVFVEFMPRCLCFAWFDICKFKSL